MKRNACVAMAALAAAALAGCGERGVEKAVSADTAPKPVRVGVVAAGLKTVERTVEVVGTLHGWEDVSVGAKKGGRVLRVLHDMGDHVKPGEKLVELDTTDARLAVAQARSKYLAELTKLGITQEQAESALKKYGLSEELLSGETTTRMIEQNPSILQVTATMEKAANNLNRQRQLHQRGAGTLEELQNLENDYRGAKAARDNAFATARNTIATAFSAKVAIDVADQQLADMTVLAPHPVMVPEGVDCEKITYAVAKRSAAEGQMLKDGDAVMELVIESPLRLWANVPERYSAGVKAGQKVRVRVASYPDRSFEGTVSRISPAVDPVSRTFQVEALIPNDERLLRPGGFAKASVVVDHHSQATTVPVESVVRFAGVTKLFVVEGDKARSVSVETGEEGPGWVEVTTPLPPGARIVTDGWTQLADGTPVLLKEESVPRPAEPEKSTEPGI
jgi:RND family efflux transporter MFP subunit